MKRVVFAWVTVVLDFDTMEELQKYKLDNYDKGWHFGDESINEGFYTLEVHRKYGNYNAGW
jgi:hypothetical protein